MVSLSIPDDIDQVEWHVPERRFYDFIISKHRPLRECYAIKKNRKRTIYKLCVDRAHIFYLKHDHPCESRHKIKALLFPKAKSEFNSAMLLKKEGIPTVPVIGWGRRYFDTFLLTKEIPHAVVLKDLLTYYNSKRDINRFLTYISKFLRLLIKKKVSHPDLHPGNILVKKKNRGLSFYLIDLYGVKIRKNFTRKHIFRLFGWLVTLLWPLEWEEIAEFLIRSGFYERTDDLKRQWERLVKWRSRYIKSRCRKRKKKLFKDSSLCTTYKFRHSSLVIKKELEIKDTKQKYLIKYLPSSDAKKGWQNSYFLSLFGIPITPHYGWLNCKDASMLIMREPNNVRLKDVLDNNSKAEINRLLKAITRLHDWCNITGIDIHLDPEQTFINDKAVFPLIFFNPEQFSVGI